MKVDSRQRLLEILDVVLAAPKEDREALLDGLCGADDRLRHQVETMLALDDETTGFLAEPAVRLAGRQAERQAGRQAGAEPVFGPGDLEPDTRLGPYRIVELVARGGMGTVYRAVREDDFEKQVAVKVIQHGVGSSSALERFHAERQILARFEHPSIAHLLDGGTTDDGRPYLVMEYVEGSPLTDFAEREGLSLRARLRLFRQLLSAVAYAHQNLVVHRDLKPSNILVTPEGVLKLLDFGIAKPLDRERFLAGASLTRSAESPLTPRYASPEQILGKVVATTSDVYSLGVLLYELLTGCLPCGLENCTAYELARRICKVAPSKPSVALSPAAGLGRGRRELSQWRRALAGDVDAIVLKALRKEPEERYSSVEQLADDLLRYEEGLPVRARRGAWGYRAGKFIRRHKGFVAAAVLVTSLGLGATFQWRQAVFERHRADLERAEAIAERNRLKSVLEFLANLFRSAAPDRSQGRQLTAEEILDAGYQRVEELVEDPRTAAELQGVLGNVYRSLGLYDKALGLMEKAVAERRKLYSRADPESHLGLTRALNNLASVYYYVGSYEEAEQRFREALALQEQFGDPPHLLQYTSHNLASTLKQLGRMEEAGHIYRRSLRLREEAYGPRDLRVATSLYALGSLLYEQGLQADALTFLGRALDIRREALGLKRTEVATVLSSLGRVHHALQELEEAEELHRQALAIRRELLGEEHAHVALARRDLAAVLLESGDLEQADVLLSQALDSLRHSQSPEDWTIASVESLWGSYLMRRGRYEEAAPFVEGSLATLERVKGKYSIYTRQAAVRLEALREATVQRPDLRRNP